MSKTRQRSTVAISFMPSKAEALLLSQQQGDPMPANDIHLTLAFLGEIDEMPMGRDETLAILTQFAEEFGPVTGKINGAGAFTVGEADVTVVYATYDSPALPAFRQALVNFLDVYGISHSMDHGFVPHMTLFRVPSGTDFEMPLMPAIELAFSDLVLMWGDERVAIPLRSHHEDDEERAASDAPNYRQADTEGETCAGCLFSREGGYCGLYEFYYQQGWVCDSWQPAPSPEESERMTNIFDDEAVNGLEKLLRWIKGLGKNRTIKEVESWDGAASNYSSTDAYCSACLIDVNAAAGRDEKVQSHCMLPIRQEGDSAQTFVAQAVFAAAGGRGITQVQKPEDVPQENWDAAVQRAANQLIIAYEEMDRVAPASVYELAGKEPPEESRAQQRAISIQQAWDQIWQTVDRYDMENGTYTWPHDIYIEGSQMFLIASRDGKMFKAAMSFVGSDLMLGDFEPTVPVFVPPTNQQQIRIVSRADNGRVRVAEIVATAVLNRVGEIDSTILFDNFIKHAHELDEWPLIDVLHINEIVVGHVVPGGLLRDGACYVAVWEFDDTPLGRAAERGYMADPDFWGSSIEFEVLARELVEVSEGVKVPVYIDGINRFITVAPESWAASFYTGEHIERSQTMDDKNKPILAKLLGDKVDEIEQMVDGVNGRIATSGQITRTQPDEPDPDPDEETVPDAVASEDEEIEVKKVVEVDLSDEDVAQAVAEALTQHPAVSEYISQQVETRTAELSQQIAALSSQLEQVLGQVTEVNQGVSGVSQRVAVLEQDDEDKQKRYLENLPRSTVVINNSHRPRKARAEADGDGNGNGLNNRPMAATAHATVEKWREQRRD